MNKRKLILNLAMSIDWYISDKDWGFDWIVWDWDISYNTKKKFDFQEFVDSIDTIIMWRSAYNDCPNETLKEFKNKKILLATHTKLEKKSDNIEYIEWDIIKQVKKELKKTWKDIWLWWWAKIADIFVKEDIIDQYIIGIIPTILWKWRPLFLENNPRIKLHLIESSSQEWIVILKYDKKKDKFKD